MTEVEWMESKDPFPLRTYLRVEPNTRKDLLFLSACMRRKWHTLSPTWQNYVEIAERVADGLPTKLPDTKELRDSWGMLFWYLYGRENNYDEADDGSYYLPEGSPHAIELSHHAGFFRDIFGNPFRPITIDPTWLSSTVLSLAQTIYDEKAFDRMPILADALEDAGCTSPDILNHCRQPGEHVKGCWCVDLILGKK